MRLLTDSSGVLGQPGELRAWLSKDGYLFFRNLLPTDEVLRVRREILNVLVAFGWSNAQDPAVSIGPPIPEDQYRHRGGIALQSLESVHQLAFHRRIRSVVHNLIPQAFAHPARIVRVVDPHRRWPVGEFFHQDWSIFHVPDLLTTWLPLGDAPRAAGPLRILAGSHRDGTIGRPWRGEGTGVADDDPRWATADMTAGDVVLFHCLTVHSGARNITNQFRISVDARWQSARHPVPEVALWPYIDLHTKALDTATHPGWEEITGGWRDREPIQVPEGLRVFDHAAPDLPRDHPPSAFLG